jgi:S-adenosylmethionine decarboxylase
MDSFKELKKQYKKKDAWGLLSSIDLYNCDPKKIRSREVIEVFLIELCEKIGMKRYGDPIIVDFGEDEEVSGYSMTQLIETSLISGHFANKTNNIYLDVFSCKIYNPEVIAEFANKFFEAKNYNIKVLLRKKSK